MFGVARRNPVFARLWLAQLVSQAGDWLNRVAILALIGELGGEATLFGLLYAVELAIRLLPAAALGPLAGPCADRLPRRALMVAADVLRAGIVLGFLLVDEPGELGLLYALLVSQMGVGIFFEAARTAALPDTVPASELHEAYVLSQATWSAMLTLGALAGALGIRSFGVEGIFVANALTYLASGALLVGLKLPERPPPPERLSWRDLVLFTDMRRGLAHARERGVGAALLAKTFWGPAGGFLVLLSIAGHGHLAEGGVEAAGARGASVAAAGFATGMLYAARGLGTGLGPVLARLYVGSGERALVRQIRGGFLVAAAGYALFALCDSLWLASLCVAVAHMGGSVIWVASTTYWQRAVAAPFRGRVFALEFLGLTLSFTLGGFVIGLFHDRVADRFEASAWLNACLVALAGIGWGAIERRSRRASPQPAEASPVSGTSGTAPAGERTGARDT